MTTPSDGYRIVFKKTRKPENHLSYSANANFQVNDAPPKLQAPIAQSNEISAAVPLDRYSFLSDPYRSIKKSFVEKHLLGTSRDESSHVLARSRIIQRSKDDTWIAVTPI